MKIIQFILIPMLVTLVVLYFGRVRSGFLDRVIVFLLGVMGTVMVALPEWTNTVAKLVGVTRGADLIIYLSLIGFAFICLMFYARVRTLELKLTYLARAEAIEHAKIPQKKDEGITEVNPRNARFKRQD